MAASGSCLQSWLTQFFCDLQGADRPVELLRPADVSRNRTKSGVSRVIWWSASKIHLGGGGVLERRAPPCHELVRVRKLKTMVVPGWTRWFLAWRLWYHYECVRSRAPELSTGELSCFRDDKRKPDRENVATSEKMEKKHERKKQTDVQTNRKQQEGLSRFRDDKGKPDQDKVASSEKDVERERERSRTKNPRDHAVNGRDNRAVGFPSYRLSLFFIRLPPFITSVTPLARALLVLNSILYCIVLSYYYSILYLFLGRDHQQQNSLGEPGFGRKRTRVPIRKKPQLGLPEADGKRGKTMGFLGHDAWSNLIEIYIGILFDIYFWRNIL